MWEPESQESANSFDSIPPGTLCGIAFLTGFYGLASAPVFLIPLLRSLIKKRFSAGILLILLTLAAWVAAGLYLRSLTEPQGKQVRIAEFLNKGKFLWEGEVASPVDLRPDGSIRFTAKVCKIFTPEGSYQIDEKIIFTVIRNHETRAIGDRFLVRSELRNFRPFANPGVENFVYKMAQREIFGSSYVKDDLFMVRIKESGRFQFAGFLKGSIDRIRQDLSSWMATKLYNQMGHEPDIRRVNAFLQAVLLGYRRFIQWPFDEEITKAGVNHLVAISGLHLACVAGIFIFVSRWIIARLYPDLFLFLPDPLPAALFSIPAVLLYALLTGLNPPVVRALLFFALPLTLLLFFRTIDPLSLLILSACFMILLRPYLALTPSFTLSFVSAAAILLVAIPLSPLSRQTDNGNSQALIKSGRKALRGMLWLIWISLVIHLTTIPLTLYYFNRSALMGIISNLILVPLVTLIIIPLGITMLFFKYLLPPLAEILLLLCSRCTLITTHLISFFGSTPKGLLMSPPIPPLMLGLYYAVFLLVILYLRKKPLPMRTLLCLPLPLWFAVIQFTKGPCLFDRDRYLFAAVLDVGQGSSTFLRFPNGYTMLVDGGGFYTGLFDTGKYVVFPFLAKQGVKQLDAVVLSHPHPDHGNGLKFLLGSFPVKSYWETGCRDREGLAKTLEHTAFKRKIPRFTIDRLYGTHSFGESRIHVLHPRPDNLDSLCKDLNNSSMVIAVEYGRTCLLIPGDIDAKTLEKLPFPTTSCDKIALIAPHHGSKHSFSEPLYDIIRPDMVIVSCGEQNIFGFPDRLLLDWCRKRGITCIRTDLHGGIVLRSDGEKWEVSHSIKEKPWRPGKCGTIFSATSTVTSMPWMSVSAISSR